MIRRGIKQLGWLGLLLALLGGGCRSDGDRPGYIVLPGMVQSLPYDAYDANPITGQTLRLPPDGTVPYGVRRYGFGPGVEEAARAGRELTNPIEPTAAALKRGKERFDIFCAVCHGPAGHGDGPIIGRFPNPPSLVAPHAQGLPDGHLFHVITHGQGIMASYAVQVPADDRWRIVHYLRTLQGLKPGIASATSEASAGGSGGEGGSGGSGSGGSGGNDEGGGGYGGAAPEPASAGGQAPQPEPAALDRATPPAPAPPAMPLPRAPAPPAPTPKAPAPASPYDE